MRLQLALDVSDIDDAVEFYSKLFDAQPYKRKPGYANFALTEPPLKLVLIENPAGGGTLNHLGVETETADQVVAAEERLTAGGLETTGVSDTTCCFADKTETWVTDPDGARWEWYVKLEDRDVFGEDSRSGFDGGACCA